VIEVLRRHDFALLWWGGLVSVAGDAMLLAVLPYVVYETTGSTLATAGMTVAELVPGIVLGSVAGVLVDRWDRRRLLVATNLLQAATVAALLVLVREPGLLAVVYVVAALQSSLSAFSLPAETSLLPTLVPEDDLVAANALNALNNRVGRLVGLPLGAAVHAAAGLGAVVALDVASFLVAAGLVALLRVRHAPPSRTPGPPPGLPAFRAEWVDGLALIRRDRSIGVLFVVFGLMTFGGTMLDPLAAPWVRDVLHEGVAVYALLMTTHSLAGIAGSLVVGAIGARVAPYLLTGVGSLVAGCVLLVRFNVPVVAVAVALSLVSGIVAVASSVGVETLAQQRVPEAFRGRVFGTLQAWIWLLSLLGAVVGGVGAELVGVLPMLDLASVLTAGAGLVVLHRLTFPPCQQTVEPRRSSRPCSRTRASRSRSSSRSS
jgi:MFS family permease